MANSEETASATPIFSAVQILLIVKILRDFTDTN